MTLVLLIVRIPCCPGCLWTQGSWEKWCLISVATCGICKNTWEECLNLCGEGLMTAAFIEALRFGQFCLILGDIWWSVSVSWLLLSWSFTCLKMEWALVFIIRSFRFHTEENRGWREWVDYDAIEDHADVVLQPCCCRFPRKDQYLGPVMSCELLYFSATFWILLLKPV